MYSLKKDRYKSARGGHSRILDITCDHCGHHICLYQKDGPGLLKRMYFDRIINGNTVSDKLDCAQCNRVLGAKMIYEKEDRPAYRLFVGAVNKKIVSQKQLATNTPL